jgi:hypothetical protein
MEKITIYPKNKEQLTALKAIAKAMGIAFEVRKDPAYDPVFVAKVLAGVKAREEGEQGIRVDVENLWE